jgi:hypothetical protein
LVSRNICTYIVIFFCSEKQKKNDISRRRKKNDQNNRAEVDGVFENTHLRLDTGCGIREIVKGNQETRPSSQALGPLNYPFPRTSGLSKKQRHSWPRACSIFFPRTFEDTTSFLAIDCASINRNTLFRTFEAKRKNLFFCSWGVKNKPKK